MSVMAKFSLRGKVAVITGGYGYLGQAMSEALLDSGAIVVVCAKDKSKFIAALNKKDMERAGTDISFSDFDISDTNSIKHGFSKINKKYGRIDVLVNNAYYSKGTSPEKMKDSEWEYGVDGTMGGVFRCIRECTPHMKKNGGGNIINIASVYGVVSPDFRIYKNSLQYFNPPNYGAAKAGVIQLTKYYAVYLAKFNIRVNCISPGAFPSPSVQKDKAFIKRLSERSPMHRIGHPDDLKGLIVFLASGASSYITGQNIIVDGGMTLS